MVAIAKISSPVIFTDCHLLQMQCLIHDIFAKFNSDSKVSDIPRGIYFREQVKLCPAATYLLIYSKVNGATNIISRKD